MVEMDTCKKYGVYEESPMRKCKGGTGKGPIGVDTNKGDKHNPENRCRLVAKEIKKDRSEDLFAVRPPYGGDKLQFSWCASCEEMCLESIDVVRAYFHAKARWKVQVELPKEDQEGWMRGL